MRFRAQYTSKDKPDYWKTIDEDSEFEAYRIAKRYIRKGYVLKKMVEEQGR